MIRFLNIILLLFPFALIAQVPVERESPKVSVEMPYPDSDRTGNIVQTYYQDGKYGFVIKGQKSPAIYDQITSESNGFIVKKDKMFSIANKNGILTSKLEYDEIRSLNINFVVKKGNNFGVITIDGKVLLPLKYNKILGGNSQLIVSEDAKGKMQIHFTSTQKTLKEKIEFVDLYNNIAFVKSGGKFGAITNKIVTPFIYDSIGQQINPKSSNIKNANYKKFVSVNIYRPPLFDFTVLKNGKLGMISIEGIELYPTDLDDIKRENSFGYYAVTKDKKTSIYFTASKKKTDFDFTSTRTDGYGFVMATKDNKLGVFDLKGNVVVPFEYDNTGIYQLSGVGFRVSKDNKKGIVSSEGKIIVPTIYDDVNSMYDSKFRDFFTIKSGGKEGIINTKGEIVIPVKYEWAGVLENEFLVVEGESPRSMGLFDRSGKEILPINKQWIRRSESQDSNVLIFKNQDQTINFLNPQNQIILIENCIDFGYLLDEDLLLSPYNRRLFIQSKNGKFGILNEESATLSIPLEYDAILQLLKAESTYLYSAKKNGKYGLINDDNQVILPFIYDEISLNNVPSIYQNDYLFVVKKAGKFGGVNYKNETVIPFTYTNLERLSWKPFFKAKSSKGYQIINEKNQPISPLYFDEVSQFERIDNNYGDLEGFQGLTFKSGKMQVIDDKGKFLSQPISMQPHVGYRTFDELKSELVNAMNASDEKVLEKFVEKIMPSPHIMYYLKKNIFNDEAISFIDYTYIKKRYLEELLNFKYNYWNQNSGIPYNKEYITKVNDFTMYGDNYVTNKRTSHEAYSDTRHLERILRNAVKINGFWISSYFMKPRF